MFIVCNKIIAPSINSQANLAPLNFNHGFLRIAEAEGVLHTQIQDTNSNPNGFNIHLQHRIASEFKKSTFIEKPLLDSIPSLVY